MREWDSLRSSQDFRRAYARGRRTRVADGVSVAVMPSDGSARIGFAVKRGAGSAVTRNRIKRRLRAAVDRAAPSGVVAVIQADEGSLNVSFQKLVDRLNSCLVAS